ncbi:MAG: putative lipid II flippase FtsW [Clostridiales bacterium]|nr:putative lipid II flippase FtsW [Clostridiales bacterium]
MKPLLKNVKKTSDYLLIIAVIMLAIIGTVFIFSASNYSALKTYGDSLYFVKKQVVGIVLGVVVMIFSATFDYNKLKKFTLPIAIISFITLILVFVPSIGVENYGAKRWIGIGGLTLQPSEIAKFSLILFSATYVSNNPEKMKNFFGIIPVLLFGGITCLLIIIEPNMSITVCVALLMLTMLFSAGMKIKHFVFLIIPVLIGGVLLILAEPYRLNRLAAFLNPWSNPKGEGYQLLQSLYALGSGGLFGVGLFNSRQKFAFLPFAESDFILSVIGEEIGFVGLFFFFLLLFFIVYRGLKIAYKSKDLFGFMLAIGITMIFGIQTIVNALVVTGSIPPTGLPLPLVSSGNTSIIIFMAEMGVLFNISKQGALTF